MSLAFEYIACFLCSSPEVLKPGGPQPWFRLLPNRWRKTSSRARATPRTPGAAGALGSNGARRCWSTLGKATGSLVANDCDTLALIATPQRLTRLLPGEDSCPSFIIACTSWSTHTHTGDENPSLKTACSTLRGGAPNFTHRHL